MLSELRPGQRRTVSEAEQGRTTLWRRFRGILHGGSAEPLAFCCPNWLFEKPNLDRCGPRPANRQTLAGRGPASHITACVLAAAATSAAASKDTSAAPPSATTGARCGRAKSDR